MGEPGQVRVDCNDGVEGGTSGSAIYSPDVDRSYRYALTRTWGSGDRHVVWLLLNPSTATENVLDPTLRRCRWFSEEFGYDRFTVLNLFAFRATSPRVMKDQVDPVGPENDAIIREVVASADAVIGGWGAHGGHRDRASEVERLLDGAPLHRLGAPTKAGHPRHPLYLARTTPLFRHASG